MLRIVQNLLYRRRMIGRLSRYISGELSTSERQEVGRALDDPTIYAAYRHQRETAQTLRTDLDGMGRTDSSTVQRGWQNIARVLEQNTPSYRLSVRLIDWRMRLAALGLFIALLIPVGLSAGRAAALSIPTQPIPLIAQQDGTATSEIPPESTPEDTPSAAVITMYLTATPIAPSK